jgi:hypothetical protein
MTAQYAVYGTFVVVHALIVSAIGGFFLKLFAKTVPYSSSYRVFVWALLRAVALGVIAILIGRYVAVPLAIALAKIFGGLIVSILPMVL